MEDGTKTDPKLEDAVAASTVPIAAFQLSGRYCRTAKAVAKLGVPAFVSRTSETRDDHSKPSLA